MWLRNAIAAGAACGFLTLQLQAQPGMQAAEQLLVPFSAEEWKNWKVGSQGKRPGLTMIEYIPKTQTVENWDRMLTIQIFHNAPFQLPQLMAQMKTSFETKQPCEQTTLQASGGKKVNGYDSSLHRLICTRSKQHGKGEFTLMLGIQGRDAVYLVQRAWRGAPYNADAMPLSKAELKAWQGFLEKVQVCDPRVPERACPAGLRRTQ
jgi:hypothetical protein